MSLLKTKANDQEMILKVEFEKATYLMPYYHVIGSLAVVDSKTAEVHTDFSKLAESYYSHPAWLDSLRVYCQGGDGMNGGRLLSDRGLDGMYAHEIRYHDLRSLCLDDIERMHKLLKTVERKLNAMRKDMGPTETTGHFFLRAAKSLGIKKMAFRRKQTNYDRTPYRFTDLPGGLYSINCEIAEWVEESKAAMSS